MTELVTRNELGQRITRAQKAAGFTTAGVAQDLNRDVRTVARWRAGDTRPSYEDLQALARLFSVPVSYFLD